MEMTFADMINLNATAAVIKLCYTVNYTVLLLCTVVLVCTVVYYWCVHCCTLLIGVEYVVCTVLYRRLSSVQSIDDWNKARNKYLAPSTSAFTVSQMSCKSQHSRSHSVSRDFTVLAGRETFTSLNTLSSSSSSFALIKVVRCNLTIKR